MSDMSVKELNQFEEIEAAILAGRSVETPRTFARPKNKLFKASSAQEDEEELNTSVSSEDMNMFRLEVLQRLTEDKQRQIPDGAEMEDDDDPILLARSNAASSSKNPPDERTRLEVQDVPADVPIDQLSPITETAEPVVSNPNSVSSANSTAPSSPCSPLDVAPFMPAFFTTSPANTLDRKNQRLGMKGREDTEGTLIGEEEDDFLSHPETSVTPRFKTRSGDKSRDFQSQSKSYEHLARGSYTVGRVSVEAAKAAGIPVIGGAGSASEPGVPVVASGDHGLEPGKPVFNAEFRGRIDSSTSGLSYQEPSELFQSRKLYQKEVDSSQDLSGLRPLVFSSGGAESVGIAPDGVDGRRDSLESSPPPSPALARGKRDRAYDEVVLRSREIETQDSPSDVVIFERSLSNSYAPENTAHGRPSPQTREIVPCDSGSNKAEAYVFDFNQDTVHQYKNSHTEQDFGTYKKTRQVGIPVSEVTQANHRAANENTAGQGFQGSQEDDRFGTYGKNSRLARQWQNEVSQQQEIDAKEFDSLDGKYRLRNTDETPAVRVRDVRQSDGFSTFRKGVSQSLEPCIPEHESSGHGLQTVDLRRSDGFTTFRKGEHASASENLHAQFPSAVTHDKRQGDHSEKFSTFSKSSMKQGGVQNHAQDGEHQDLQQAPQVYDVTPRPLPSRGGEGENQTSPRGGEQELARVSGSSSITRSRTFRKTPDGQIVEERNVAMSSSSGSSASGGCKVSGQQAIITNIRGSPEGAGSDNPQRISWTDESEAGARLLRHSNASVDRSVRQLISLVVVHRKP